MTIKMKIVQRYDFRYYDKPLPKGAIYGQDENGLFACYNWQNLGSPKNPCLKIWRPDPSNSRKNWIKWGCRREKGETAAKILSYYQNHRSKCLIDYGDQAHEVASKQDLRRIVGAVKSTIKVQSLTFKPKRRQPHCVT